MMFERTIQIVSVWTLGTLFIGMLFVLALILIDGWKIRKRLKK